MPLQYYKLNLAYDGTSYFGWQKTKMGASIQESLQIALYRIAGEELLPQAASRTDRGVHAEGQIVSISLHKEWDPAFLKRALNAVLPLDIRVKTLEKGDASFHPALHAVEKEYHYRLCLGAVQDPVYRLYSWAFRYPLCTGRMQRAAEDLLGKKNFSAFANLASDNPICTLSRIAISPLPEERLQIAMTGDRFLYKMARNIAGTLIYIGCGKLAEESIPHIFSFNDRRKAGVTAPALGLTLYRVAYNG